MAVRPASTLTAILVALSCALGMAMPNVFQVSVNKTGDGANFLLGPTDPRQFRVRGVFILDEGGAVLWAVVSGKFKQQLKAQEASRIEIRGGEHVIYSKGEDDVPPSVRKFLRDTFGNGGKPLTEVTYGEVPPNFYQLVPANGKPPKLTVGNTYRIYVLGSEGGAVSFKM